MYVHTHNDFRSSKLTESMLDAVGNVSSQSHLRLHVDIGRCGPLLQLFQQAEALFTVLG